MNIFKEATDNIHDYTKTASDHIHIQPKKKLLVQVFLCLYKLYKFHVIKESNYSAPVVTRGSLKIHNTLVLIDV